MQHLEVSGAVRHTHTHTHIYIYIYIYIYVIRRLKVKWLQGGPFLKCVRDQLHLKIKHGWAGGVLSHGRRVGGNHLASHVVSSRFIGTGHEISKHWYWKYVKTSDPNPEHRDSTTSHVIPRSLIILSSCHGMWVELRTKLLGQMVPTVKSYPLEG